MMSRVSFCFCSCRDWLSKKRADNPNTGVHQGKPAEHTGDSHCYLFGIVVLEYASVLDLDIRTQVIGVDNVAADHVEHGARNSERAENYSSDESFMCRKIAPRDNSRSHIAKAVRKAPENCIEERETVKVGYK